MKPIIVQLMMLYNTRETGGKGRGEVVVEEVREEDEEHEEYEE